MPPGHANKAEEAGVHTSFVHSSKINSTELEPQTHFNYLGITINKHTIWDGHVNKIAIKISKASGIIFKLNDVLPNNVLTRALLRLERTINLLCH